MNRRTESLCLPPSSTTGHRRASAAVGLASGPRAPGGSADNPNRDCCGSEWTCRPQGWKRKLETAGYLIENARGCRALLTVQRGLPPHRFQKENPPVLRGRRRARELILQSVDFVIARHAVQSFANRQIFLFDCGIRFFEMAKLRTNRVNAGVKNGARTPCLGSAEQRIWQFEQQICKLLHGIRSNSQVHIAPEGWKVQPLSIVLRRQSAPFMPSRSISISVPNRTGALRGVLHQAEKYCLRGGVPIEVAADVCPGA